MSVTSNALVAINSILSNSNSAFNPQNDVSSANLIGWYDPSQTANGTLNASGNWTSLTNLISNPSSGFASLVSAETSVGVPVGTIKGNYAVNTNNMPQAVELQAGVPSSCSLFTNSGGTNNQIAVYVVAQVTAGSSSVYARILDTFLYQDYSSTDVFAICNIGGTSASLTQMNYFRQSNAVPNGGITPNMTLPATTPGTPFVLGVNNYTGYCDSTVYYSGTNYGYSALPYSGTLFGTAWNSTMTLGVGCNFHDGASTTFFPGNIGEILIYDQAVSNSSDQAAILNYLVTKWL